MAAAVLPLTAITLGALHVLPPGTAVLLAFAIGVVTLTAQGVRYAKIEHLSRPAAPLTIGLNLAAGLALVALEAIVSHQWANSAPWPRHQPRARTSACPRPPPSRSLQRALDPV